VASISKRRYWADPKTGREVPAGTPGAERKESRFWRIRYRDSAGRTQSAKGYVDLRATRQLAARLEAAAAQGEEGLLNRYLVHDRRPLEDHVGEYIRHLQMLGRDDKYCYNIKKRIDVLMTQCNWKKLRDITAESFNSWREKRHGQPDSSGKTLNQWLETARAFLNWCASPARGRVAVNPLAGIEKLPHTPTFQRRALQPEELSALFNASSVERYRVYVVAVTTGLRRAELEDLQWGDVVLDAPQPFLSLRDYATKARRADVFALKSEVAALLKEMRPAEWAEKDKVFARVPGVDELLADLAAAGVALPVEGSLDRIDFHALRTTLGSLIGRAGIPERVGMELLRVTDSRLLRQTYCDPRILQTHQAAQDLPIPTDRAPPSVPSQNQRSILTGTDTYPLTAGEPPVQNRTQKPVGTRRIMTASGGPGLTAASDKPLQVGGISRDVTASDGKRQDGQKAPRVGLEPTKKLADFAENFRFPGGPGPVSDSEPEITPEQPPPATPPAPPHDPLFDHLVSFWPSLSQSMRESIVALASAAAKDAH